MNFLGSQMQATHINLHLTFTIKGVLNLFELYNKHYNNNTNKCWSNIVLDMDKTIVVQSAIMKITDLLIIYNSTNKLSVIAIKLKE